MTGIIVVVEPDEGSTVVEVEAGGQRGPQGETGEQGPIGLTGGRITREAGEPIPSLHVVLQGPDGRAYLASSSEPDSIFAVLGVAEHNAVAGELLTVVQTGVLTAGSPFPVGPLFLDEDGSLTPDPNSGSVQLHAADAVAAEVINVRLEPAIHH